MGGLSNKTIGRNDPCPCKSGKKYKKCCMGHYIPVDQKGHIVPLYKDIDYGDPVIDDAFFQTNNVHEISGPRLFYSNILIPEIEKLVSEKMNIGLNRAKDEKLMIEKTNDPIGLIKIMKGDPDVLNHELLRHKIVENKKTTIPIILEELKLPQLSSFFELAVYVIYLSGFDCTDAIIDILKNHQRSAWAVSLLCMLIGFWGHKKNQKVLWDYYHYFRENFKNETYSDGPLLGLIEMREQRKR